MADAPGRLRRQPVKQRRGLFASVGFHHPDKYVEPLRPQPPGLRQHGEGFPDARAGPEENFQLAAMRLCGLFEQPVRIRAHRLVGHLVFP